MHTTRRAGALVLASLLFAAALSVAGAQPAGADTYGMLATRQGLCLENHPSAGIVANTCLATTQQSWYLEIVDRVGQDPRYRIRNQASNTCLVAFASSGRVGTYRCNSNWADQVWALQYVKLESGISYFWVRNKHSGRCLGLNLSYNPDAFMTTCADYRDQLWDPPG